MAKPLHTARRVFAIRKRELRARSAWRRVRDEARAAIAEDAADRRAEQCAPFDIDKPTGYPPVLCALGFVLCVMCVVSLGVALGG